MKNKQRLIPLLVAVVVMITCIAIIPAFADQGAPEVNNVVESVDAQDDDSVGLAEDKSDSNEDVDEETTSVDDEEVNEEAASVDDDKDEEEADEVDSNPLLAVTSLFTRSGGRDISADVVTDIKIDAAESPLYTSSHFGVTVNFAENSSCNIQGGDTIVVNWNNQAPVFATGFKKDKKLYISGRYVADAHVQQDKAIVTFNDAVNDILDVVGSLTFTCEATNNVDTTDEDISPIEITSGNKKVSVDVLKPKHIEVGVIPDVYKPNGVIYPENPYCINWWIEINRKCNPFRDDGTIYIDDTMGDGQRFNPELTTINFINAQNYVLKGYTVEEFKQLEGVVFEWNKNDIHIEIPKKYADGKHIQIWYKSDITHVQKKYLNRMITVIKDSEGERVFNAEKDNGSQPNVDGIWEDASIFGTVPGEIKIHKVLAGDENLPLEGVEFKITSHGVYGDTEQVKKTNSMGLVDFQGLWPGTYTVEEISAPSWIEYDKDNHFKEVVDVNYNGTEGVFRRVKNDVKKTDITVDKTWLGNETKPEYVSVGLYNGYELVETRRLTNDYNWKATFTNLPLYDEDGQKITYHVEELGEYDGWKLKSSTVEDGQFKLVNVASKDININVEKKWQGTKAGSVEIMLQANGKQAKHTDGKVVDNLVLNESSWTGEFRNLPKYDADGNEIKYLVKEVGANLDNHILINGMDYKVDVTGNANDGFVVTNSLGLEIAVDKKWVGPKAQQAAVDLYQGNKKIDTAVLNEDNGWHHVFKGLNEAYKDQYKIKENFTNGIDADIYKSVINGSVDDGIVITNYYQWPVKFNKFDSNSTSKNQLTDAVLQVTGTDAAGNNINVKVKPAEVLNLGKGEYTLTEIVTPEGYKTSKPISFTIDENGVIKQQSKKSFVEGLLTLFEADDAQVVKEVTMVDEPEVIDIAGTKTWNDASNRDGKRPNSLSVKLYADGSEVKSVNVNPLDGDTQDYKFENLPEYRDGKKINYTVVEDAVSGYTAAPDGYNWTNTYTPEVTNVTVVKQWDDNNNQDGKRKPVEIQLKQTFEDNGQTVTENYGEPVVLDGGDWSYTWSKLPLNHNGKKIEYSVEETTRIDRYTTSYETGGNNVFKVVNTLTPETINITGAKTWKNGGDKPFEVTFTLYKDGSEFKSTKGIESYEFKGLDKYKGLDETGKLQKINYEVKEEVPANYKSDQNGFNFVNTKVGTTSVHVTKKWIGAPVASVDVQLYKYDNSSKNKELVDGQKITLSKGNNWEGTFEGLSKYDAGGNEVEYCVKEVLTDELKKNYAEPKITGDMESGFVITNTNIETVNFEFEKIWNDDDSVDHKPVEVLIFDMTNVDFESRWEHPVKNEDGTDYKVVLNNENDWKASTKELPKYDHETGVEKLYGAYEERVDGYKYPTYKPIYDSSDSNYAVGLKILNTRYGYLKASFTKDWIGESGDSATIVLKGHAEGSGKQQKDFNIDIVLDKSNNYHSDEIIPRYDEFGREIKYSVAEENLAGYKLLKATNKDESIDLDNFVLSDGDKLVLTNKDLSTRDINVNKIWSDGQSHTLGIEVQLLADGAKLDGKVITLTSADGYKGKFRGLPKYADDGHIIKYSIEELTKVTNYVTSISGSADTGFNIFNTAQGNVSFGVTKKWIGEPAVDEIEVKLLRSEDNKNYTAALDTNGNQVANIVLNEKTGWSGAFNNLPEMKDNKKLYYKVEEVGKLGSNWEFFKDEFNEGNNEFVLINKNTTKTTVNVNKVWKDEDSKHGPVKVQLLRDNEPVEGKVIEVNQKNSFDDLDVYDQNDGHKYIYSVTEIDVPDSYEMSISKKENTNDFTITNTKTGLVEFKVNKEWIGKPLDTIYVGLYDGDKLVKNEFGEEAVLELSPINDWKGQFFAVPKYNNEGKTIEYSVREEKLDTNTYVPSSTFDEGTNTFKLKNVNKSKINIPVEKKWIGEANASEFGLFVVGTDRPVDRLTLTKDKPSGVFDSKFRYNQETGERIDYEVRELNVPDNYRSEVRKTADSSNPDGKYVFTNVELTNIKVEKKWNGKKQDTVNFELWVGDKKLKTITVKENNGKWIGSFDKLDKYASNNALIDYEVREVLDDGYVVTGSVAEGKVVFTNSYLYPIKVNKFETGRTVQLDGAKLHVKGEGVNKDVVPGEVIKLIPGEYTLSEVVVPEGYEKATDINFTVNEDGSVTQKSGIIDVVKSLFTEPNKEDGHGFVTMFDNPTKVSISVKKTWKDNNNQDGIRPDELNIRLFADNTLVDESAKCTKTDNTWTYTFDNMPEYKDGHKIAYRVDEDSVPNYSLVESNGSVDSGFELTNEHTPDKIGVIAHKIWDDHNNNDGMRPDSVDFQLWVTTDLDDSTKAFENFPKVKDAEDEIDSFEFSHIWNKDMPYVTHDATEVVHNGVTWKRVGAKQATENNGWKVLFDGLDKNIGGKKATYFVYEEDDLWAEQPHDAHQPFAQQGNQDTVFAITNKHADVMAELTVNKAWDDNNNQDGIRPNDEGVQFSVSVVELDGKKLDEPRIVQVETVKPDENGKWHHVFTLPKYIDGKKVKYDVSETVPAGYSSAKNANEASIEESTWGYKQTFDFENTHTPETLDIKGNKIWDDEEDFDGLRPDSIEVKLLANGKEVTNDNGEVLTSTASVENDWKYEFDGLPKCENGKQITYTVEEVNTPELYESKTLGFDITNTHVVNKLTVEGLKVWDDADNQDGIRPEEISVELTGKVGDKTVYKNVAKATSNNGWKFTFNGVPQYIDGDKVTYTVNELSVPGGYSCSVVPRGALEFTNNVAKVEITNAHTPDKTRVEGQKIWNDEDNRDGVRPEKIVVNLFADGELKDFKEVTAENEWKYSFDNLDLMKQGKEIVYTVGEQLVANYNFSNVDDTYDIKNTYTPGKTSITVNKEWKDNNNQDGLRPNSIKVQLLADGNKQGKPVELTADNNWSYTFKDLYLKNKGKAINYSVEEVGTPKGYDSEVNGFTITNTHTPETTNISGSKIWDDKGNQDGKRPDHIVVKLLANGSVVQKQEVKKSGLLNNTWNYEFVDLPVYDNGKKITYSVEEDKVEGYESSVNEFDITNSHTPEVVVVEGTKTWRDNSNQDGVRPSEITVRLLADNVEVDSKTIKVTGDTQTYKFENQPKYKDGKEIAYSIVEDACENYSVESDGLNLVNVHTPEKTTLNVVKVWDDANNQDGLRPNEVQVQLYANGKATGDQVVLNEANGWAYTFGNLDMKANGEDIKYTVSENDVKGYECAITGDMASGYTITNTHKPETINVLVNKVWNDANNQDGIRPDSINVQLLADGVVVDTAKLGGLFGSWEHEFSELPVYKDGHKITYTVKESSDVVGYESSVDGFTITNTHTPQTIVLNGIKVWNDANNQDGMRPDKIVVVLKGSDNTERKLLVDASTNWTYSFTDLPKFSEGKEIEYSVSEVEVDGYESQVNGLNITNTHAPELVSVEGSKTWVDNNNQDGMRPKTITFRLLANGSEVDSQTVDVDGDTQNYKFENLPKYEDGVEITYSVVEVAVDNYTPTQNGNDFTNTHTPDKTSVSVSKVWDDDNNRDGIRPVSVEVTLLADGVATDKTCVLNKDNNWTYTFTDLDMRASGTAINYTVDEGDTEDYVSSVEGDMTTGYTITNTHEVLTRDIEVVKKWVDADNIDKLRPENVTVALLANGVEIDSVILESNGNWSHVFEGLPVNENGKEIEYSVVEKTVVQGYESSVDGFTIINTHTPTEHEAPKKQSGTVSTGDTTKTKLTGIASAIGAALVVFGYKKYKDNE